MTARPLALAAITLALAAAPAAAQPLPFPPAPPPDPGAQLAALRTSAATLTRVVRLCEENYQECQARFERDPLGNASAAAFAAEWRAKKRRAELDLDTVRRRISELERGPRF